VRAAALFLGSVLHVPDRQRFRQPDDAVMLAIVPWGATGLPSTDMGGYPNGTQEAIAWPSDRWRDGAMPLLWLPLLCEPGGQTRHEFRPPLSMVPRGTPLLT
jgi:hypothetical protein